MKTLQRILDWCGGSASGNVTPIMAIAIVPIVGAFAVATETSNWMLTKRSMQNAADSAALAAAINNTGGKTPNNYIQEAAGVATRYGFTQGVDNTTVTTTYPWTCPAPWTGTNCYRVVISKPIPIRLARLVGYQGDVALGGGRARTVTASSVARTAGQGTYCITALGTGDDAIQFKGAPMVNLTGCDIASAGGASCNGQSGDTIAHAYVTVAGKSNDNCTLNHNAADEIVGAAPLDIYASRASNIDPFPCTAPTTTNINTPTTWTSNVNVCGNLNINANVSLTGDVVLTVKNGNVTVAGGSTLGGGTGNLTIVFSGSNAYSHTFTGGGTFDFQAPTSGPWSGIAIYQDPALTSGVSMTEVGNTPTYKVTGLLYLPRADIVIKGAINHKTGGDNCFSMVVRTLDLRGTGGIFSTPTSECDRAGLVLQGPPGSGSGPTLVQ